MEYTDNIKFSTMPEQKVKPVNAKRARELLMGPSSSKDAVEGRLELAIPAKKPMHFVGANTDWKSSFILRAKLIPYDSCYQEEFFSETEFVKKILHTSKILVRLGIDVYTETWKIFIKKNNFGAKPSIVQILLPEVKNFVDYAREKLLPEIDEGVQAGYLAYIGNGLEDTPNYASFWESDKTYMSETGTFPCRAIHKTGRLYHFYINTPGHSDMYEKYFGPRICMTRPEFDRYIDILQAILLDCPPIEQM